MGAGNTKQQKIEQIFKTDVLNKEMQQFISNNSQKVTASGMNSQKLEVFIGGNLDGCDWKQSQSISSKVEATGELTVEQLADLKKTVETNLKNSANAELEQKTSLGSIDFGSKSDQDIKTEIETTIDNITEQVFSQNNYNEVLATQTNIQKGKFTVLGSVSCREDGGIDLEQEITSQLVASTLTDSIIDAFMDSNIVNDVTNTSTATAKKKDEGFSEISDSFFDGIANVVDSVMGGNALIIFIIVIIFLAIGGGLYAWVRSKKGGRGAPRPPRMAQIPYASPMPMIQMKQA